MELEEHLNLEVLLAVLLLIMYVIAAPIFEKIHFHYMHESGMVMILGIIITLSFKLFIPSLDFTQSLAFNDKIFFTFVLPLIIFGAGYNLKKRQFFKYFTYIFLLGVVGTLIAFCWVAPITYFFDRFEFFYLSSSKYDFNTLVKMGGIPVDPFTKKPINYTVVDDEENLQSIGYSKANKTFFDFKSIVGGKSSGKKGKSSGINSRTNSKSISKPKKSVITKRKKDYVPFQPSLNETSVLGDFKGIDLNFTDTNESAAIMDNINSNYTTKVIANKKFSITNITEKIDLNEDESPSQDEELPLPLPEPEPTKEPTDFPKKGEKVDLKLHPIRLSFSLMDALSFAAVISATDAVAALTFIHEESEPKLFSILFGEGVVNDAVCIVIYKILTDFQSSGNEFTLQSVIDMLGTFCSLFIWSFFIGLFMGIVSSLLLKKLKKYNIGRSAECALICLFAYLSYILSEELELSPIISLLFNGIFNSHYTFYNLSFQAREESSTLSKVLSAVAEAFVFVYLGLTAIHYFQVAFSWSFMFFELCVVVLGRFASVYGICLLMDCLGVENFKLSFIERGIASCSGTIRGAIAFGLSCSIVSKKEINKEILLSTTLALVFISTILFGALMPYFIKFWKSFGPKVEEKEKELISKKYSDLEEGGSIEEDFKYSCEHPNFNVQIEKFSKEKDIEKLKKRLSYWLGTYWLQFDDAYLKPKLICNWPEVKKEHDEIAEVITNVCQEFLKESKVKKILNENLQNNQDETMEEIKKKLTENEDENEDMKDPAHKEFKTTYTKFADEEKKEELI